MKVFFSIILLSILLLDNSFAGGAVKDVSWDKAGRILTYQISQDAQVKIRVGSPDGPVYRSLVNIEPRKAGKNRENWNGRDETGLVDFPKYGPLHFCVDIPDKLKKDLLLSVTFPGKTTQNKKAVVLFQGITPVTLNIEDSDKAWFCGKGMEIMVFLDNKLIKWEKTERLPRKMNLELKNISSKEQLLTFNLWSPDHTSVAYKSLLIKFQPQVKAHRKLFGKIVYCQRTGGFWQVWSADLHGSTSRQLTKTPGDKRYPVISSDGKQIAYVTNTGELCIMDSDGENNHKVNLPVYASQPRWSPDAGKIAFVSYQDLYHGDAKIWEIDLQTSKLKKLINRPWLQYGPCYSPDGNDILFTDGPELYAQDIYKLNLKTNDVTQITDNQAYDYDMQPCYAQDAKTIVYSSNESGHYDIWIADKFGRDKTNLTPEPAFDFMPQFTADGRRVYFLSDRSGFLEIWRIDIDGKNLAQITRDSADKQDLAVYTY